MIRLGPGLTLMGQVLDLAGKPIGGQPLMLTCRNAGGPRVAVTDADGRFRFNLLRPGSYVLQGEGPDQHFIIGCPVPQRSLDLNRVIRPIDVYLKKDEEPAPVELQEAETVLVQVQIEGVRGELPPGAFPKAALGGQGNDPYDPFREQVSVFGSLPNSAGVDRPDPGPDSPDFSAPSAKTVINDAPPDTRYGVSWRVSGHADARGRVALRALKGLRHTRLWVETQGPPVVYKTHLVPGSPWRNSGVLWLGTLESDHRAITAHGYFPATVVATIRTEGGEQPPADVSAQVNSLHENFIEGLDTSPYMEPEERVGPDFAYFEKEADGRFRCKHLVPDHEYAFFARATGYVPLRIEHRSVHEGNEARLTLVMRKAPKPLAVGTPAPAFTVGLVDNRSLSLGDLRGKFVLVHFWFPVLPPELNQIKPIRAVLDRFSKDDRLVVLGFCLANNPEGAERVIRAQGITWPQAVLRDAHNDPIAEDYPQTGALLIGPDARVLARDLTGDKIGEAVARALGRK